MKKKFWSMTNKSTKEGEVFLYGDISSTSWWGDEVTPTQFKQDLDALGSVKKLNIYINSLGGDLFAGQAIYSMIRRHKAKKTVYIDGLAASAASIIAMAGDTIIMPHNSMLMIHNCLTIAMGNANDFRKLADDMDKIGESIVSVYTDRTALLESEVKQFMDDETWFTAQEAVDYGFADEIEEGKEVAATIDGGFLMLNNIKVDASRYKNMPEIKTQEPQAPQTNPQLIELYKQKIKTLERMEENES